MTKAHGCARPPKPMPKNARAARLRRKPQLIRLRRKPQMIRLRRKPQKNSQEIRMTTPNTPLWEVFIRSRNGLAHKHVGSLHASDATLALQAARDIYTRRGEGLSIWVVPSSAITASDPSEKGMMFEPAESKIYRHPTFYDVPEEVGHM